jgi:ribosomal protein S16
VKHIQLNFDRIKYWLAQGAQPTQTVALILGRAGILPSIPRGLFAYPVEEGEESSLPEQKEHLDGNSCVQNPKTIE